MWFQFTLNRECKGTQELIALFWQDSEFSSSEEYWRPRHAVAQSFDAAYHENTEVFVNAVDLECVW